jgi:hypothetical protein
MRALLSSVLIPTVLLLAGCQPMNQVDSSAKSPSSSKPASNGQAKKAPAAKKDGNKSAGKPAAPKEDGIVPPPNKPGYAPLP